MKRLFKRKLYDRLLFWKTERKGKTAVLIEGARRVGKSTLVEIFAKNEYKSYILIDFGKASARVKALFDDLSDLNYFFLQLQFVYRTTLHVRDSVIIFDEVQLCPKARQAIKYLVADGRYDYIETGSLISLHKNVKDILIPSEESKLSLHPMDYEEFRWALGDTTTFSLLREWMEKPQPFGNAVHRKFMQDFRLYMLVGGMPQAVDEFLESNNIAETDRVKREILALYEDDFHKFDPTGRASSLFDGIPSQLTGNASRYQLSSTIAGAKQSDILEQLSELQESQTVQIAYRSNDPGAGLSLSKDFRHFKLFTADTGLFVTLAFKDKDFTENVIYRKLLGDKLKANLGYVYENMTAQMLTAAGYKLFYHTFPTQTGGHNYKVDFLIPIGDKVCPIEVKSSGYKSHASLDAFCRKYHDRVANPYVVYTKDYAREGNLTYLPIYLLPLLQHP